MEQENGISDKILIKQREISVEKNFEKKSRLQKELQILNWRKQIDNFKLKITQLRNGMV